MFYKKSVYRSLLLVTGLGFAVITPVILCIYGAYWLKQTYGFDIFFAAIILGILSGIWNAYKSINYFLNKVKEEDRKSLEERTKKVVKQTANNPKKKSRIFKEDR